jgi:Domain of unknown function (DUF5666)
MTTVLINSQIVVRQYFCRTRQRDLQSAGSHRGVLCDRANSCRDFSVNRGWHERCDRSLCMKRKPQLIELSLCLVCALAPVALLTLQADPATRPQSETARADDQETIQGKVSEKSDTSLKVDGKTITVSAVTSFTKDGKTITISDVQKGDSVKVKTSKGTDGSLQAVSVEVLVKK